MADELHDRNASHHCDQLVAILGEARGMDDIHGVCSQLCLQYGFDGFLFGVRIDTQSEPTVWVISGHPAHHQASLVEGYLRYDPSSPARADLPFAGQARVHDIEHSMLEYLSGETSVLKMHNTTSFPVKSAWGETAVLTLYMDAIATPAPSLNAEEFSATRRVADQIQGAVRRLVVAGEQADASVFLTERESDCMRWAAEGKTSWEIAQIHGVSEHTITFHLKNATGKLRAANRQQAIARAVYLGLVTPHLR